jgi:hypothetical protein
VVSEEPADRFGGLGKMLSVLPRLGGRRECGDLAAGLGRVVVIDSGQAFDRIGREPVPSGVLRGRSGYLRLSPRLSIEGPAPRSPLIGRAFSVGRVP